MIMRQHFSKNKTIFEKIMKFLKLVTNFAKLDIIWQNFAKFTKVFCENMRNFGKIIPQNFAK
jgi:hypothetical protein